MAKGRKNSRSYNGGNGGYGAGGGGATGGSGGDLATFFDSPRGGGFRLTSDKYTDSADSADSMRTVH